MFSVVAGLLQSVEERFCGGELLRRSRRSTEKGALLCRAPGRRKRNYFKEKEENVV